MKALRDDPSGRSEIPDWGGWSFRGIDTAVLGGLIELVGHGLVTAPHLRPWQGYPGAHDRVRHEPGQGVAREGGQTNLHARTRDGGVSPPLVESFEESRGAFLYHRPINEMIATDHSPLLLASRLFPTRTETKQLTKLWVRIHFFRHHSQILVHAVVIHINPTHESGQHQHTPQEIPATTPGATIFFPETV